jgi:WW domain-containing oxidoreductase
MNPVMRSVFGALSPLFLKTSAEGAATECFVATHPSLASVSGQYFADCNVKKPRADADDAALAQRLWAKTEQIVTGLA